MTRKEKAICKEIYKAGKDLGRKGMPKRKDGSIIYLDEYFKMLAGIVLRDLPENETLLRRARYAPAKSLVARLFLPLLRNKGHKKAAFLFSHVESKKRRFCVVFSF